MNNPYSKMQIQSDKSSLSRRSWMLIGAFTLLALVLSMLFKPFSLLPVGIWILWCVAIVAFLAPIMALAVWRGKPDGWHDIMLALGVWFMNFSCMILMRGLNIFSGLEWNWMGKVFAIIASLVFIGFWGGITWREVGFTGFRKGSWLPFIVLVILSIVPLSLLSLSTEYVPTKVETLLFQLTLPSIDEEIIYRGILLVLLNRAFGTPWKVEGANVGWGWLIISVLCGLGHGIGFTGSQFQFSLVSIITASIVALTIGWMRERTGSLYAAIFLHTTWNSTGLIINAILNGLA